MKTHAGRHGDPRFHAEDIARLKARVAELEGENERLRLDAGHAQPAYCTSTMTFNGRSYACDGLVGHNGSCGGSYPQTDAFDVLVSWTA